MKRLNYVRSLVVGKVGGGKNEMCKTLLIAVVFAMFSVDASANNLPTCDPNSDPWGCECDSGAGFRCDIVEEDVFSHLSDHTQWDTGNWVTTTFNQDFNYYEVTANLEASPSRGVFPVLDKAGDWNSPEELAEFVSNILQVPLTSSGKLYPFVYRQIGSSYVVDLDNQTVYPSNERFWWGLIRDPSTNAIGFADSVLEAYLAQFLCGNYNTTIQTVAGQFHSLEQQNSICHEEVGCHGPNCDPDLHSATNVKAHMLTRALSLQGTTTNIIFESLPVEYAQCDQFVCTFDRPRVELLENHQLPSIRVIEVVADLDLSATFTLNDQLRCFTKWEGAECLPMGLTSEVPTSAISIDMYRTQPHPVNYPQLPFNSYCTSSASSNELEMLEIFMRKSLPFASNLPACP